MNETTFSQHTVEDIEEAKMRHHIAPLVFLAVLLLISVPVNLTVLVIYGRKYAKCVYRTIIWNLALVDLIFCSVGLPFNIARIVRFYSFTDVWVCKIFTTLLSIRILYSTHLLMLLSLHRFRQICMPLRTQISSKSTKYWIFACFVIGVVLSIGQLVLEETEEVKIYNLTGSTCPITPSNPSVYWMINNIFLLSLFLIYTFSLFFVYISIGRKIYLRRTLRINPNVTDIDNHHNTFSSKMTKIAFAISVVFAASYLPLGLLRIAKKNISEDGLTIAEFSLFRIAERSYLVNHVANPFIYAAFDKRFRKQFRALATFKWRFQRGELSTSATTPTSLTNSNDAH